MCPPVVPLTYVVSVTGPVVSDTADTGEVTVGQCAVISASGSAETCAADSRYIPSMTFSAPRLVFEAAETSEEPDSSAAPQRRARLSVPVGEVTTNCGMHANPNTSASDVLVSTPMDVASVLDPVPTAFAAMLFPCTNATP